jgi:hypothetical protein
MSAGEFKAFKELGAAISGAHHFRWAEYRAIHTIFDENLSNALLAVVEWASLKMKTNTLEAAVNELKSLLGGCPDPE